MKWHRGVSFLPVAAAVLLFCLPLLGSRFIPSHDGEYHIIRYMEFFRMLSSGVMVPRWAPTLNSGYGMPLFIFHYPFPNYVGALFHVMGSGFVEAFRLSLAAGYAVAAVGCYLFLRALYSRRRAAVIGTVAMLSVPYWFVDIYVRGSVGEVWALAWMFVGLAAVARGWKPVLAVSVAGLVVSHNILAMLFVPVLLPYAWVRDRRLVPWAIGGIGMSAYFWLPALAERGNMVGLNTVDYRDHFASVDQLLIPSWGTEFSGGGFGGNRMSLQLGIAVIVWIGAALGVSLRGPRTPDRRFLFGAVSVAALSVLFMLPVSAPLWSIVTPLQFVQYPWRLLSFIIIATPVAAGYAASRMKPWLAVAVCVAGVAFVYPYSRPVTYEPRDDAYYRARRNFTDGTSSMGNSFSTVWTPWKSVRPSSPVTVATGSALLTGFHSSYTVASVTVSAASSSAIEFATLYYPGWTVTVDGKPAAIAYRTAGTLRVSVPAGTHTVVSSFGETPLRGAADGISLVSAVCVAAAYIMKRRVG